jgi:hypothetical protein
VEVREHDWFKDFCHYSNLITINSLKNKIKKLMELIFFTTILICFISMREVHTHNQIITIYENDVYYLDKLLLDSQHNDINILVTNSFVILNESNIKIQNNFTLTFNNCTILYSGVSFLSEGANIINFLKLYFEDQITTDRLKSISYSVILNDTKIK